MVNHVTALAFAIFLSGVASGFKIVDIPGRARSTAYYADVRALDGSGDWETAFVVQTTSRNHSDPTQTLQNCGYYSHLNGWSQSWVSIELDPGETGVQVRVGWYTPSLSKSSKFVSARTHPRSAGGTVAFVADDYVYLNTSTAPSQFHVDFNEGLDNTDTGKVYPTGSPPVHTFAVFVNPPLAVPDQNDPTVYPIQPGNSIPTVPKGSTLLFLDGIHKVPCDSNGWCKWKIPSEVEVFLSSGAVLHAALSNSGSPGQDTITIKGYGILSGEDQNRAPTGATSCPSNNVSPLGIHITKAHCTHISGITIVDFPKQHLIATATGCSSECEFNTLVNVKILGWRANGDGVHNGGSWKYQYLFIRTNDDAMYTDTFHNSGCPFSTFSRVSVWTDCGGNPLIISGHDTTLEDSDVLYHRPTGYYTGHFRVRNNGPDVTNSIIRNVRVEDPFSPCNPWNFNREPSQDHYRYIINVTFEDIQIDALAGIKKCTDSKGCGCEPPCAKGSPLPYGPPNLLEGGMYSSGWKGPQSNITNLALNGVTVMGKPLGSFLAENPGYFNVTGHVYNVTVDGVDISKYVPITPPQ